MATHPSYSSHCALTHMDSKPDIVFHTFSLRLLPTKVSYTSDVAALTPLSTIVFLFPHGRCQSNLNPFQLYLWTAPWENLPPFSWRLIQSPPLKFSGPVRLFQQSDSFMEARLKKKTQNNFITLNLTSQPSWGFKILFLWSIIHVS